MKENVPLTAERLREELDYNPETGVFTRLKSRMHPNSVGRVAGGFMQNGYWQISLLNQRYLGHRLAWLYVTGRWPTQNIDHIDGDRANNRWANLRDVPQLQNTQNIRAASKNSKSGLLGASPFRGKWVMQIKTGDRLLRVPGFSTAEAAHAAYLDAKRKLHEGCTI